MASPPPLPTAQPAPVAAQTLPRGAKLCTRCHSAAKPKVARVAVTLFVVWLIGFGLSVLASVLSAGTGEHPSPLPGEFHLLLLVAVFHPLVCPRCASTQVIPLDTPAASKIVGQYRV